MLRFSRFLIVVLVVGMASSMQAQRRRAVDPPMVPVNFQAAIDVVFQTDGICRSVWHVFSPGLSTGDMIEVQAIRLDGTLDPVSFADPIGVQGDGSPFIDQPLWQGLVWDGPISSGVTTFRVIVTRHNQVYKVSASANAMVGPLFNAISDANGGVLVTGVFLTPPVISSPYYLNIAIMTQPLYGGWYIPPGQAGRGKMPIVVSSGIGGNPYDLKSETLIVDIP